VTFWYHREAEVHEGLERLSRLEAERAPLLTRVAELSQSNADYREHVAKLQQEIGRLDGILKQISASRTWKLHLWLERLRGR
jgi:hypothetical protein